MDTTASLSTAANARRWQRLFRALGLSAACCALLLGTRQALQVLATAPGAALLLFGLIFLSRCVPVALSREKPVTFTAVFVFAASLLLNGVIAGWSALIACFLHARFLQRGGRAYAFFVGAQYALAALAAHRTFVALAGRPQVSDRPGLADFGSVCAAALVFAAVNGLLSYLGDLGTRYAHRQYVEPVFYTQLLAYGIGFPFGILLIFAYRAFGLAALPCLAALLLVCAHAVRVTVENRMLTRQLWAVEALGHACASEVHAEKPLTLFLSLARDLVAFERAVLWLENETRSGFIARAVFPQDQPVPDAAQAGSDTLIAWAARHSAPLLVADAGSDPRQPAGATPASWILYPLVVDNQTIGVAQFIRSHRRPFTRPEVRRLAALISQAAFAFESVYLRYWMHRYENIAITDGLTGLLNHRGAQEKLRDEMERASRFHHPLSILMLDVDSFKQFNDAYGHPQGDKFLQDIAQILRHNVRSIDKVGRYGGEEFIILLPETARADAYVLAERIRTTVENEWFAAGDGEQVRKTISIGVASFPEDAAQPDELVQHADTALYRAKRTGKNRVLTA